MRLYLIIILMSLMLNISCTKKGESIEAQGFEDNKIDTITYSHSGFNYYKSLDLLSNNKFIRTESFASCFGGGRVEIHYGTFVRDSMSVELSPKSVEVIIRSDSFEVEKNIDKTVNYGSDSLLINVYYNVFDWGSKQYLLSEEYDSLRSYDFKNDYQRFADYYNRGLEPLSSGNYLTRKQDASENNDWDVNKIPLQWRSYFLNNPMSAKVTDVKREINSSETDKELELSSWVIEIDKGKVDGVFLGLSFQSADNQLSIVIDSISKNKSFANLLIFLGDERKFNRGTELRTNWE